MSALFVQYKHNFALYYNGGSRFYKVENVAEMNDKAFVQSVNMIMIDAIYGKGQNIADK